MQAAHRFPRWTLPIDFRKLWQPMNMGKMDQIKVPVSPGHENLNKVLQILNQKSRANKTNVKVDFMSDLMRSI